MIISLLILSITILAVTSDNSDIPVNVKILKHVEISVDPSPMNNWRENMGYDPNTESLSIDPVDYLDPEQRDHTYQTLNTRLTIKSNIGVVVKSYFRIDEDIMKSDFYNDPYNNTIEGSILYYWDTTNGTDTLPIPIVRDSDPITTTDIEFEHHQDLKVDYKMKIRFTDDNWWKILAGEHTIGQIVVTVEAK
jgi:hypothetical protein